MLGSSLLLLTPFTHPPVCLSPLAAAGACTGGACPAFRRTPAPVVCVCGGGCVWREWKQTCMCVRCTIRHIAHGAHAQPKPRQCAQAVLGGSVRCSANQQHMRLCDQSLTSHAHIRTPPWLCTQTHCASSSCIVAPRSAHLANPQACRNAAAPWHAASQTR